VTGAPPLTTSLALASGGRGDERRLAYMEGDVFFQDAIVTSME